MKHLFLTLVCSGSVLALALPATASEWARGSCYAVERSSSCIDYNGSGWTVSHMKGHCTQPGATWYKQHCPQLAGLGQEHIGSCTYMFGLPLEWEIHYYFVGGGGYKENPESIPVAEALCGRSGGIWQWGHGVGAGNEIEMLD